MAGGASGHYGNTGIFRHFWESRDAQSAGAAETADTTLTPLMCSVCAARSSHRCRLLSKCFEKFP
jgi:hypothetical protein